ncbi:MAG: serine hydrolase domain-containing protein [Candidatus Aminicenantales bacterium]
MIIRTRILPLILLFVLAATMFPGAGAATGAGPAAEPNRGFVPDTKEYLSRLEKLGFAGVVLVAVSGEPALAQGYGLADRERGIPWTPGTISCVGSITKQFTAASILKLEEAGKLRVSDPITKYFSGVPPDKSSITIHELLTHTSGIEDLDGRDDYDPIGREEFVRLAMAQPLSAPPGTHYSYSNAGFSLLGAIIEKLTGASYEQYLRGTFFLPLGMYETGYILPAWGEARLAQGYRGGALWGTVLGHPMDADGPYWVLRANGGIHSSPYDMLRWARALMEGRVLKPESMAKLWTPHVPEGGDSFYGYGWSVRTLPGDIKVIAHNAGNGIFFADFALVPKAGLVIFLQTNVVADMPAAQQLMEAIGFRYLANRPYPEVPKVVEVPESGLAAFEGSYRLAGDGGVFRVKREGKVLALEPEGQAAFSILHSTQPLDPRRRNELDRLLDKAITACRAGDYKPFYEAYGGKAPLDLLKNRWQELLAEAEKENGRFQRHEILGTARTAERDETVVRLIFEKGTVERTYVWSFEEKPRLQGVSRRGLKVRLQFLPESRTEFASWDGGIRPSKPLRFEKDADGRLRLRLGAGDLVAVAAKQ